MGNVDILRFLRILKICLNGACLSYLLLIVMFEFKILKRSKKSRARLGVIKTPHGEIETPAFIPVATRATVRTLSSDEVEAVQSPALICNTYHLHTTPGEKIVKKAGGL